MAILDKRIGFIPNLRSRYSFRITTSYAGTGCEVRCAIGNNTHAVVGGMFGDIRPVAGLFSYKHFGVFDAF